MEQLIPKNRHQSTSLRKDLQSFSMISLSGTNIMQIAFQFGLDYVTERYKLSLLLLIMASCKELSALRRQVQPHLQIL